MLSDDVMVLSCYKRYSIAVESFMIFTTGSQSSPVSQSRPDVNKIADD